MTNDEKSGVRLDLQRLGQRIRLMSDSNKFFVNIYYALSGPNGYENLKMEANEALVSKFSVRVCNKYVVKASDSSSLPDPPQVLSVSNLDLLSGRFPVTYLYMYQPFDSQTYTFESIVANLKQSLSKTLIHFHPFAGRIVKNDETGEPEICCDNTGVVLVEALANMSLREVEFYNLDGILKGKLVASLDEFDHYPMQVQVTSFACGRVSLTVTFDHLLGDASAFGKFLRSWSELATHRIMSCVPDHNRQRLKARRPPSYHESLDQAFMKCTLEEIGSIPTRTGLVKRLYFIDASSTDFIRDVASSNGEKRTKIEAFSAYVWMLMAKSVVDQARCRMGWLVDGRTRMSQSQENHSMENYIGNVLSLAQEEANVEELKQKTLPQIATLVHNAISKVTNDDHFRDLIDWIECHRPGLMLAKIILGCGNVPSLVISSGRRFPVSEVEFGFGKPVLGTVCSVIERIGVAYLNQRPSAKDDGSWTVSAILWPELAAVLESDGVFQPMSATHVFNM